MNTGAFLRGLVGLALREHRRDAIARFPSGEARAGAIAIIGDLQRTSLLERAIGREQNDAARARIVAAVAREAPTLVVLLGDLVGIGASRSDWRKFDRVAAPLLELGAPVVPILGNHDCWGPEALALGNFEARFPHTIAQRWSTRRHGRLGLVWLDSNREHLGPERWAMQRAWFARTLGDLDADPRVHGVLAFVHHPPFTNSRVTSDGVHVQEAFVGAFTAARKTLAMFSGHVHAYEHFVESEKHLVVSGGGGGPRVALLRGSEARHKDRHDGPVPRPFHFLWVEEDAIGVSLRARAVGEGGAVHDMDRIDIAFASRVA